MNGNEEIFPIIDKLRGSKKFDYTFRTRDWHPANQANNPGSELFKTVTLADTGVE